MARRRQSGESELVLLPLGGTGEIGMNCYLYGWGPSDRREWLMVDLGVKFGEESEPGIDVVLPDLTFAEAERRNLTGIVLTHAHEDHMGAVTWLWPRLRVPVYCTPFCAGLLKRKLAEHGLDEEVPLRIKPLGSRFSVGNFDLEYIAVTHSIPEPSALAIRTAQGTVLHSGDWKIDRTPTMPPEMDEARLRQIGEEGVTAFVCDSTNVLRAGHSPSEAEVAATLERIVSQARGRVAITTFASHVGRIGSAVKAARLAGREVVIAGRAMRNTIEVARECGYLREAGTFLEEEAFGYVPPDKVMLICTGSQGEPRAAIARIAEEQHPQIELEEGDLAIFSSKTIPGNEKAVSAVQNNLARLGVSIVTSDEALVHTSGHPRQEELRALYSWLKPKIVVPMHGEARHLHAHAAFARSCGIPEVVTCEDGAIVRLAPGPAGIIDEAPAGRLHVDGRLIVSVDDGPARRRRKLSFVGLVSVSLVLDGKHQLARDPIIVLDGLPLEARDGTAMADLLLDAVEDSLESLPRPRRRDDETIKETIRTGVRRAADAAWGKKPICHVLIHRL
jgi:ribonuclease J